MSDSSTPSEEMRRLYREILSEQEKMISALRELSSNVSLLTLLQVCRDNERDLKIAKELSDVINRYLDTTKKTFQEEVDSFMRELEEIDDELNKNLAGVFEVILEFVNKIRKIKGIDTRLGIARIESLVDEMINSLRDAIKLKKEAIENLYNEIENTVQEIVREKETLSSVLSRYSAKNVFGRAVIIGVPIIKTSLESAESYIVLGGELAKHEDRILDNVRDHKFGVNHEMLARVLQTVRLRKGFLYKIFLDSVVKVR
ncbi:MAG: hypothetical protein QW036_03405 [Zestosphaera sp.]